MKATEQERGGTNIETLKDQLRQWRRLVNYLPQTDCDRDDVTEIEKLLQQGAPFQKEKIMEMNSYRAYKVTVKTTGVLSKTTYGAGNGKIGDEKDAYLECENGVLFVVTDDPRKIYDQFPLTESIIDLGVGYSI